MSSRGSGAGGGVRFDRLATSAPGAGAEAALAASTARLMGYSEEQSTKDDCLGSFVEALIRPLRADYGQADLGPREAGGFRRDDFSFINGRGKLLRGSWWRVDDSRNVLVYLHANSSSRVEALKMGALKTAAAIGHCDLVAFDFAGKSFWSFFFCCCGLLLKGFFCRDVRDATPNHQAAGGPRGST